MSEGQFGSSSEVNRFEEIYAGLAEELIARNLELLSNGGLPEAAGSHLEHKSSNSVTPGHFLDDWASELGTLSKAAEGAFFGMLRNGNDEESEYALERILASQYPLVTKCAEMNLSRGGEIDDLIQAGFEGVLAATKKFDVNQSNRFGAYAVWWIRQAQVRSIDKYERVIRVPSHAAESYELYQKLWADKVGTELELLVDPEICEIMSISPASMQLILNAIAGLCSIDDKDVWNLVRNIPNEIEAETAIEVDQFLKILESILDSLSERESGVIRMRFGLGVGSPATLDEIGEMFGVTRERIRQIESKTMAKLRHPSRVHTLEHFMGTKDGPPPLDLGDW